MRTRAFTLIELLLVLAIIAVVTAITAPSFVRSIRGNRLRTAARQVVMAGRYARSMAVMQQQQMNLVFDVDGNSFEVRAVAPSRAAQANPGDGGDEPGEPGGTAGGERLPAEPAPDEAQVVDQFDVGLQRRLDRVRIESVEIVSQEDAVVEGKRAVSYYSNGTCQPYAVRIVDEFGSVVMVSVDALGSAESEQEEGGP